MSKSLHRLLTKVLSAIAVALSLMLTGTASQACSFAQPHEFEIDSKTAVAGETPPPAPAVKGYINLRGHFDPQNPNDSCADTGLLVLFIPANRATRKLGYIFEVISSTEEQLGPGGWFENPLATDIEDKGKLVFLFPWLDGASNVQEPLQLKLRVTAVRKSGKRGPSIEIEIRDPGRP